MSEGHRKLKKSHLGGIGLSDADAKRLQEIVNKSSGASKALDWKYLHGPPKPVLAAERFRDSVSRVLQGVGGMSEEAAKEGAKAMVFPLEVLPHAAVPEAFYDLAMTKTDDPEALYAATRASLSVVPGFGRLLGLAREKGWDEPPPMQAMGAPQGYTPQDVAAMHLIDPDIGTSGIDPHGLKYPALQHPPKPELKAGPLDPAGTVVTGAYDPLQVEIGAEEGGEPAEAEPMMVARKSARLQGLGARMYPPSVPVNARLDAAMDRYRQRRMASR